MVKKIIIPFVLTLAVIGGLLLGCAGASSNTQSQRLTDIIASIIAAPYSSEGQQVTIVGYYRGWDLLDEANAAPPVTRSDWVIKDASGAIYISAYSEAKVAELDPSSRKDIDTILKLTGIVRVTPKGQPYIEATSIERGESFTKPPSRPKLYLTTSLFLIYPEYHNLRFYLL